MRNQLSERTKDSRLPECAGGFVSSDLKAYLDKELSPIRAWYVGRHVARCHACREEVVWLQRLGKNMRMLEDAHPRPELRARILSTLPAMEAGSAPAAVNRPARRAEGLKYAFGGALCFLVLAGAFAAVRGYNSAHSATVIVGTYNPIPNAPVHKIENTAQAQTTDNRTIIATPDDPTSKLANEIYAREMQQAKDEAARRLPDEWKRALVSARAPAQDKHSPQPYVQVTVDVQNSTIAEEKLVKWARSAHAAARVAPALAHRYTSVVLAISPAFGEALLSQLKMVGDVSAVKCSAATSASQLTFHPAAASQVDQVPSSGGRAPNTTSKRPPFSGPDIVASEVAKPDNAKATAPGTIMVVVMLTPGLLNRD